MKWVGLAFGLFVLYRVAGYFWWRRNKNLARNKRIEKGLAEWQEAHPGQRISEGTIMDITGANWDE